MDGLPLDDEEASAACRSAPPYIGVTSVLASCLDASFSSPLRAQALCSRFVEAGARAAVATARLHYQSRLPGSSASMLGIPDLGPVLAYLLDTDVDTLRAAGRQAVPTPLSGSSGGW